MNEIKEIDYLIKNIDKRKLPKHVAIIMDGNGRWAKKRGLNRIEGHKEGTISARRITEIGLKIGIKYLTFYTFSTENWKRPAKEVNALMDMLFENLVEQKKLLVDNKIKLKVLGNINKLPKKLREKIIETEEYSKDFNKMQINLALNYGSREEITEALKRIVKSGIKESKINEKLISDNLYTKGIPDPDLLIRTSGEFRISNFLLYQIAYSEFHFTDVLWPDFREHEFLKAIIDYQNRERRFGGV